jgi:hypothetical protein
MKMRKEKGIALPLVMIAIMFGAIIIPSFLGRVSTSLIGSRNYRNTLDAQYAGDAAAEHAIWNLEHGSLADAIPDAGDTISYNLGQPVNGLTPQIKVSNAWDIIAWDNFNSGDWTGGSGWLGDWTYSGSAAITSISSPYEGTYHVRLTSNTGVISREVDLSKQIHVHLCFWAKADSLEPGNTAICRVSPDGSAWTTIKTWADGDDDALYHYYDFDITSYGLTGTFFISFQSLMNSTTDYLYVDDLKVVWPAMDIELTAEDNLETGDWAGGEGWLGNWIYTGDSSVTTSGTPYGGSYHLLLQNSTGYTARAVDLSAQSLAHLQFWAKVYAFEGGDYAYCLVSSDNVTWNTVYTFDNQSPDNTYLYYDIDISAYDLTSQFWIAFQAGMNQADDYFYVDDISINAVRAYCITITAGDRILKAAVDLMSGTVTVLCWWYLV